MSEPKSDLPINPLPYPEKATLVVGARAHFIDEMRKHGCTEALLTVTCDAPVKLTFAPPDALVILSSARIGIDAYLYQALPVCGGGEMLTTLDYQARPAEVRALAEAQLEDVRRILAEAGLDVREGMWSRNEGAK